MVTFEQLDALRAIARAGTYSQAASDLYLTQSAVSQRIKHLELALGAALFDHSGHGSHVSLTPSGTATLAFAQHVAAELEQLKRQLRSLRTSSEAEVINIAVGPNGARYVLPNLLRRFQRWHPRVRINVVESTGFGNMLSNLVRTGTCELAIGSPVDDATIGYSSAVAIYHLKLVARSDHPLVGIPEPQPSDVLSYPFAVPPRDAKQRKDLERLAISIGTNLEHVVESGSFDVLKDAVLRGIGLAIVPDTVLQNELDTGEVVSIRSCGYPRDAEIYLLYSLERELSPMTKAFLEIVPIDALPTSDNPFDGQPGCPTGEPDNPLRPRNRALDQMHPPRH